MIEILQYSYCSPCKLGTIVETLEDKQNNRGCVSNGVWMWRSQCVSQIRAARWETGASTQQYHPKLSKL